MKSDNADMVCSPLPAPSGSRDDAWEPDDYPRTSPSPYDGLRTQWLIVALSAVSVAWVVVAWWRT
jgi:hypothetical protein